MSTRSQPTLILIRSVLDLLLTYCTRCFAFALVLLAAGPSYAQREADGALQLGETGYIDFGDPGDAFDLVLGQERTFMFWMRYPRKVNHVKLLDKRRKNPGSQNAERSGGYTTFIHQFTGTAGIFVDPRGYGRNAGGAAGLRTIADGTWHHVAYVQADTLLRIVVDGQLDETHVIRSRPEFLTTDHPMWYGWNSTGTVHNTGGVDELSVWHRALTVGEVRRLMYTRPAPDAVGLTAYYPMDTLDQQRQVRDHGPNGYHAHAYEAALVPASRPTAPPWTTRWWFKALLAVAAFGALYALMRAYAWRIERKRRMLEAEVKARTHELSGALETVEAQATKLREVDEAKNRFVASISHEFRTPLTLALGLIHDLTQGRRGTLTAAQRRDLVQIGENNRRLLRLVNQLLDIAQLEARTVVLRVRRLDIAQLLHRIAEAFGPLAERKQVRFERAVPTALDGWADPDQIELIATNLLSNAFKFTPTGGTVRLALYSGGGCAVLDVEDTGEGISEVHLPHIFDRFYQADESHKQVGTGIGLATLKEVVDLHGGTVDVVSTPGGGSRFTVRLPIERAHFEASPDAEIDERPFVDADAAWVPPETDTAEVASGPAHDDRTTVLIVDDHADIRAFVRRHLAAQYRVLEAEDGVAALEAAHAHLPDLILSDVMMPRMDGLGLLRALRADAEVNFIPVILLTARAAEKDRLDGLLSGADDYLTKPFQVEELRLRVRNAIQQQQRLRAHLRLRTEPEETAPPDNTAPTEEQAAQAPNGAFTQRLFAVIDAHLSDDAFNVEALADAMAVDRSHLYRLVHDATGQPPSHVLRVRRLERAHRLLCEGAGTVSEVAYAVGFNSASYFSKRFRERFGTLPSQVSAPHKGQDGGAA